MKLSNTCQKNTLENLRQEIKAAVMEKHEFETPSEF